MSLLNGVNPQNYVSDRYPMPVDNIADTSKVTSISAETVQLYYFNSGVVTIDAGQVAGTVVVGKLLYSGILDSMGAMIGNDEETSFAWITGTVLPQAQIKMCSKIVIEQYDNKTLYKIATQITANYSNGDWCLDHRTGLIFGKKATTGVSDTANYKIQTSETSGGGGLSSDINLDQVGGVATNVNGGNRNAGTQTVTLADNDPVTISLGIIDDWDETDRAKVNPIVGNAGVTAGAGVIDAGTQRVTIASDDHIVTSNAIPTTLNGGDKTVTTSGTAEALGTSLAIKSVYIRAKSTNTSFVCVGDSAVDEATNQQVILYANDSVTIDIDNRGTVYIDADVSGEGVDYLAMS
jgi:hypothetical protein